MTNTMQHSDPWAVGNTDAMTMSDETLFVRIAEVIAWCNSLEGVSQLRSASLRPRMLHNGPDDAVCDVGWARERWYRQQEFETPVEMPDLQGGELMVYFPDQNLSDGYAELVSEGFFDVENTPPFDTWVAFFDDGPSAADHSLQRYLLCFVPRHYMALAEAGIEGNPEECILWLKQAKTRFNERVTATPRKSPLSEAWRRFVGKPL